MRLVGLLCSAAAAAAAAGTVALAAALDNEAEEGSSTVLVGGGAPADPFSLPRSDKDPKARAEAIQAKRQGILYGPGPDQNFTLYPAGPIGDTIWQTDFANLNAEQERHGKLVVADVVKLNATLVKAGGLRSLKDYSILYDDQWKNSMGELVDMSYFRNYTQDLFFSMQRLTINPFALRRLGHHDRLPFRVSEDAALKVSTWTTRQLRRHGRLFYVNHKGLARIPRQPGRFSASCEALFFIHPESGDFLPLAIKTNEGSNLIYTPADAPADWLFAKILFGQNDVWDTPWRHFASTHLVVELPYLAAQRCMGDNHPILGILKRLMLNTFALRRFIQDKLYAPGQYVDKLFAFSGHSAMEYTMSLYRNGDDSFQANYFPSRLQRQGLVDSSFGPPLKHFPFAEDAARIEKAFRSFMTVLVRSYYGEEQQHAMADDDELRCWFDEAKQAGSVDFPHHGHITADVLVDILTHMAYLGAVQHQALNNNDEFINALLPMSPMALYRPLPAAKGLSGSDIVAFLPNATQSVGQLTIAAAFSRPEFVGSDRSLLRTFADEALLSSLNDETKAAAAEFGAAMQTLSHEIGSLSFGADGLCRGAPFKWQSLDPKIALYAMSI